MRNSNTSESIRQEMSRFITAQRSDDPIERAAYPAFDEEPVPFEAWLKDPFYMGLPPLSDIQLDAMLHAERVYYEPTFEALGWPDVRSVFEIDLAWGKGSGKGFVSRIILSRIIYLMMCLDSPQGYFGMPGSESISVTNVATAAPQAKHIFFDPWVELLSRSPYFRSRMEPLARSIEFEKGLMAFSGHSSVESQEGQNLLAAVLDEISGFKTSSELSQQKKKQDREPVQSAEGVHRMAKSSIRSRFPETGKLISISFTRFKNDMIDQLVRKAEAEIEEVGLENSTKYASRRATWEVNPLRKRSDFDQDYRDDPEDAQCRYECRPLSSPHRFFKNLAAVRSCMGMVLAPAEKVPDVPTVGIEYFYGSDPHNPDLPEGWQVRFDLTALPKHRAPMAVHLDLGISHDLAGLAGTHVSGFTDHTETITDPVTGASRIARSRRPQFKTDFVIAFEQVTGDPVVQLPPSDIQIRWIRQLVLALINGGWNIAMFTADGYQSTDTFQLLGQHGVRTELYSLDRKTEGYDILKNVIYSGDIAIPWKGDLFTELESLVKVSESKIDHQAGMSKDLADALAGSVRGATVLLDEGLAGVGDAEFTSGGNLESVLRGEMAEVPYRHPDAGVIPALSEPDDDDQFWSGGNFERLGLPRH